VSRVFEDWMEFAACSDADPALFFPDGSSGASNVAVAAAKKICEGCDVRLDCLEYALSNGLNVGVWGATSEGDRRKIRRQRALARRKAERVAL
jgi:WhiB family redox-sensing transcriptional regulator